MTKPTQKHDFLKDRARELAHKHRREAYQRQKEYRRKLREEEKAREAEEKRRDREQRDAELWTMIRPGKEQDDEADG